MSNTPFINLSSCDFNKKENKLTVCSELVGMPRELIVHSDYTGKDVVFRVIGPEHPQYDEDQWDGEQQIYRPLSPAGRVKTLVIYHQY